MAEYGLLSEVVAEPRGSFLAAAASVSDTELTVEYAGDFDPEGGILDLNGTRIEYAEIVDGINPDDPDTLTLAAPLTVNGDESDTVQVVIAGQLAFDYVAHVGTDDGDQVSIPLRYDQIAGWPIGIYDPPVPVTFSEDHEHLEDAPGRTPLGRIAFHTDTFTVTTLGDQVKTLTYLPIAYSEHVNWNGVSQTRPEWSRAEKVVSIPDPDDRFDLDDVIEVLYAYDAAAEELTTVTPGDDTYPSEVLADNPLAYYRLGEASGTTMADSSGNGHDGTYTSVTLGAAGLISNNSDTATTFGASSKGEVAFGSWAGIATLAVEAWIKPSSVSGVHVIVSRHSDPAASWSLRLDGTALKLVTWQDTAGVGVHTSVSTATFAAGTRYHVVAVVTYFAGVGFVDFFVDGVAAGDDTLASDVFEGTAPLRIGASYAGENFAGVIDEVALYTFLSGDRIAAHRAAGV